MCIRLGAEGKYYAVLYVVGVVFPLGGLSKGFFKEVIQMKEITPLPCQGEGWGEGEGIIARVPHPHSPGSALSFSFSQPV